jgi:hypothetical protein
MCLPKSMMFNRVYSDAKILLLRGESYVSLYRPDRYESGSRREVFVVTWTAAIGMLRRLRNGAKALHRRVRAGPAVADDNFACERCTL